MRVSIYWLAQATEKHRGTVKKRVAALEPDKHGRYDSAAALEAIYCGAAPGDNGEFISTPEAFRLLTLARKRQIEIDVDIKRRTRIPIEDCERAVNLVFGAIRGIVKANLSVERANEVFDEMRRVCDWLKRKYAEVEPKSEGEANGSNGR
jgi:hypothetical protein